MTTTTEPATIAPEGDDLARQTAQAKLLREARDELAKRARSLADAKDRNGLERMGLPAKRINELIDGAQFNTEDMAGLLGVDVLTVRGWMAPASDAAWSKRRTMSKTAKLLLERILADKRSAP